MLKILQVKKYMAIDFHLTYLVIDAKSHRLQY